jgi:hypothetical protein
LRTSTRISGMRSGSGTALRLKIMIGLAQTTPLARSEIEYQ